MNNTVSLANILFGFKIESVQELQELLENTCVIGGNTRLVNYIIEDGYVTIDILDSECNPERIQFKESEFISARIGGRNRHGKRVAYVKEANILTVQIEGNWEDVPESERLDIFFEAIIDEDKVWKIVEYIRM